MVVKQSYLRLFLITVFLLVGSSVYGREKYVAGELIVKYKESINRQIVYAASGKMRYSALNPSLLNLHQRYGLKKMHRVLQSLDTPGLGICNAASFRTHLSKIRKRRPGFDPQDPTSEIPNLHNIYRLIFEDRTGDMQRIAKEYARDSSVEYAHPNYILELAAVPNDPNYNQQWAHQNMNSETGWSLETGVQNVVIAIVDTGVDWDHPDLSANIWSNAGEIPGNSIDDDSNGFVDDIRGWDFVDAIDPEDDSFAVGEDIGPPDNDPMDFYGHGSMVAGAAASVGNNSAGGTGVAWNCSIMPLRVGAAERDSGNAYIILSWMTQAVYYAGNNGAEVICLALVDNNWPSSLKDALDLAYSQGAVIVGAAGNEGSNGAVYPAAYPKVIGVAATDQNDQRAIWGTAEPPLYHRSESNFGAGISVAAPGTAIYSTAFNNNYGFAHGTSMSTGLVCGLAGLIRSHHPALSNVEVMKVIYSTTDPVISDKYIGTGRINVYRALQISSVPIAEITAPAMEEMIAVNYAVTGSAGGANFSSYFLKYGKRFYPDTWETIITGTTPVDNGVLGTWKIDNITDNLPYTLRLTVYDTSGNASISEMIVYVQKNVQTGWPQTITEVNNFIGDGIAVGDLDNDGDSEIVMVAKRLLEGTQDTYDLYVLNSDGSQAMGWPVTALNLGLCPPTLADLTSNGRLEIILSGFDSVFPDSKLKFHVFDDQGNYLPGWPVSFISPERFSSHTPSVGDIDNNVTQEIVFAGRYCYNSNSGPGPVGRIYIYRHDGTPMPGWPITIDLDFPESAGTAQDYISHAALADLDNDQDMEIVVCVNIFQNCHMYVYHHDASVAAGWPIALGHGYTVTPVIGDLDNDGDYEIIGTSGNGMIYAWNHDGTVFPGWPVTVPSSNDDPALADLDKDGDLEIIFHNTSDQVYAYHHNGTLVNGWPQLVEAIGGGTTWCAPIIGDITGDSEPEIILPANHETMIYAWHADGRAVADWPKNIPNGISISPALVDLNSDGTLDMAIARENVLDLWSMSVPYQRHDLEWPMSWFNAENTATYSRDIDAPVVAITNPAPDATVSFLVNIKADASDNVAVVGVSFKVDGTTIGREDNTVPYSILWDSTTTSNGNHVITALARDRSGNQTLSQGITVMVDNSAPPASGTASFSDLKPGEIIVIGSTVGRGAINPDQGQCTLIYFNASQAGRVECRIFTLTGELVWQEKMENVREGSFVWQPVEAASGIYVVLVKGPGLKVKKKIAVLK